MILRIILGGYLLGFLITWILAKLFDILTNTPNDWEEVQFRIRVSLLSWIGVAFMLIAYIVQFIIVPIRNKINKLLENKEPPKWL